MQHTKGGKMIDTKKDRKNLYMRLTERNVIGALRPLLNKQGFKIRYDGRFTQSSDSAIQWDSPWIHQYQTQTGSFDCYRWHTVFFNTYGLTPTRCQNCWKVVVMPKTLVQLFDLYELQKEMERPCKCGIELRSTDERDYGGYFYNDSFESGQECYKEVRKQVSKHISKNVNVTLKCGCTEFELKNGPNADYVANDKQLALEEWIKEYVVFNDLKWVQHEFLTAHIMLSWIHRASKHGDMSYKTFTDGNSLVKTLKTYHKEKKNG